MATIAAGLAVIGCGSGAMTGGGGGMNGGGVGGTTGNGTCTAGKPAETGQMTSPFEVHVTEIGTVDYYLQVNHWNNPTQGNQTIAYGGDYFFKVLTQTAVQPTTGGPTGFPSAFIGANSNHSTGNLNLPKQVSALTTVPTSWTWNDNGTLRDPTNNSYNATYDVWFSTSPDGEPSAGTPSAGFLMVWYWKPPDAQPIGGSPAASGVTIPGVSGTWDVWIGPNAGKPVVSYVATSHVLSLSFDLNAFIQDAVNNRRFNGGPAISSSWYLTNVFAGFEIWRGGVNLESTAFCADVN